MEEHTWFERVAMKHTLPYWKLDSQSKFTEWHKELKSGALWKPRQMLWSEKWEGCSRGRGHMYTCGWFMLTYDRNHHIF